jgi:glucose-6-phosphate dehydrogenase assembly protein OpcA
VANALSAAGLAADPPRAVPLAELEHELARPWRHPAAAPGGPPAARSLMGNLVVLAHGAAEAAQVTAEVETIVTRYPSRVIVLVVDAGDTATGIQGSVATYGRLQTGSQQVCGELVTLRAGAFDARRLPSMVRELLRGDLPTTLWWATPEAPPLAGDLFTELARPVAQVVYDSFGWADPLRQLVVTAGWVGRGGAPVASDLAWRRPRLWRRILAQALDPGHAPGAFESIREVHIEHGPHALTQAWLLAGWLAFRLGWEPRGGRVRPGPEVSWAFAWANRAPQVMITRLPDGLSEIRSLQILTSVSGRPVTFRFAMREPGRITATAGGLTDRVLSLTSPVQTRAELVARQLPDLARDRLFEASVALARAMAEAVL